MKPFSDMNPLEKLDHIERCMQKAQSDILELTYLADIIDIWDYWVPYLIKRLRELEGK